MLKSKWCWFLFSEWDRLRIVHSVYWGVDGEGVIPLETKWYMLTLGMLTFNNDFTLAESNKCSTFLTLGCKWSTPVVLSPLLPSLPTARCGRTELRVSQEFHIPHSLFLKWCISAYVFLNSSLSLFSSMSTNSGSYVLTKPCRTWWVSLKQFCSLNLDISDTDLPTLFRVFKGSSIFTFLNWKSLS